MLGKVINLKRQKHKHLCDEFKVIIIENYTNIRVKYNIVLIIISTKHLTQLHTLSFYTNDNLSKITFFQNKENLNNIILPSLASF